MAESDRESASYGPERRRLQSRTAARAEPPTVHCADRSTSAPELTIDFSISGCSCSMALPWPGHFVNRSKSTFAVGYRSASRVAARRGCRTANSGAAAIGGSRGAMGSIGRYIFRTTFGAFLVILVSLTALIWITQALRDIDLMTNQGQTILVFVGITGLIIPLLMSADRADRADDRGRPHAQQAQQRFRDHRDERRRHVAVAGVPRRSWRSRGGVADGAASSAPISRRRACASCALWLTEVRADVVTNIVQPGRFTTVESGLTIHIRERLPNGAAGRHHHRRPARPEGAHHHPGRAGRDPRQRQRHLPRAAEAAPCSATRPANAIRPSSVRPICVRSVAVVRRRRRRSNIPSHERYLWELLFPRSGRSACRSRSPASSAPSCITASRRRFIRSPSS